MTNRKPLMAKKSSSIDDSLTVGFIGIGVMGEPMALNLLANGVPLIVWNRTPERLKRLEHAGAQRADSITNVFQKAETVILMLVSAEVIDQVLGRNTAEFTELVTGHTIINMATTPPEYSLQLEADLRAAGAQYIEAPVSGQRPIAESAKLVAMVAGNPEYIAKVEYLIRLMCSTTIYCGEVPKGVLMKLAVNLVSGCAITSLAEGVNYARRQGLSVEQLESVLNASSLASNFYRIKLPKLATHDFSVQGALRVGRKDFDMMSTAAAAAGAATPMLNVCRAIWDEAIHLGFGKDDVSAVIRAYEQRSVDLIAPTGTVSRGRFQCRLAEARDVSAINQLVVRSVRAFHPSYYKESVITEATDHAYGVDQQLVQDHTYFVIEIDNAIAAAGGWSYRQAIAGARKGDDDLDALLDPAYDAARVRAFYVDPIYAHRGLGALLLVLSETAARIAGFKKLELTSTLSAFPFYAKFGYIKSGDYAFPLPSGTSLQLVLMSKQLKIHS